MWIMTSLGGKVSHIFTYIYIVFLLRLLAHFHSYVRVDNVSALARKSSLGISMENSCASR